MISGKSLGSWSVGASLILLLGAVSAIAAPTGQWTGTDNVIDPTGCEERGNVFGPFTLDFDTGVATGGGCVNDGTFEVLTDCEDLDAIAIEADFAECGLDRMACTVLRNKMSCTGIEKAYSDGRLLLRSWTLRRVR